MDLYTDNKDNLVFSTVQLSPLIKDATLLSSDIYPILALRNYLRANKVSILSNNNDLSEIYSMVIEKSLSLSLDPDSLLLDAEDLKKGEFNLKVNLSAKSSTINKEFKQQIYEVTNV